LQFRLDTNNTIVSLNGTNFNDGPTHVWNANNLGDEDHQLLVVVNSLQQNGVVAVDYFEYVIPLLHFVIVSMSQLFLLLSGLKIRLDTALIFSGPGQTPRMYLQKRLSWTILARILSSPIPLGGILSIMLGTTDGVCHTQPVLVHR
jgi:hypothetical protein